MRRGRQRGREGERVSEKERRGRQGEKRESIDLVIWTYLNLLYIRHNESLGCIHRNTNVVVGPICNCGALRVNVAIQNGIAAES